MKKIDLIIVNYNSTDCAIDSILSAKEKMNSFIGSIVVSDNASTDNPERLFSYCPEIKLICNKSNYGYSKAINIALKQCPSPYVAILNPDTYVVNGFLKETIAYLEKNKKVAIVGPKILDPDGSVQGSARRFPTLWTSVFGRKSPLTKLFPNNPITRKEFFRFNGNGKLRYDVDWVSGACMVIKREALDQINGFDEDYFLYWEDADLCKKLKNKGWRVVYDKKALVIHDVGKSSDTRPVRSIFHFHYSSLKYFIKNSNIVFKILYPIVALGLAFRCLAIIFLNLSRRNIKDDINPNFRKLLNTTSIRNKFKMSEKCESKDEISDKYQHNVCKDQGETHSRLMILNQYYPPDRSATAGILKKIVSELSNKHLVTVVAGRPSYLAVEKDRWKLIYCKHFIRKKIIRVGSSAFARINLWKRVVNYLSYLAITLPVSLFVETDVIIAMTDPPLIGFIGAITSKLKNKPFIYYIQDLHPDMAYASGMIANGRLLKFWFKLHDTILKSADKIIVIGEDMRERVVEKGVDTKKIMVIRHGTSLKYEDNNIDYNLKKRINKNYSLTLMHAGNIGNYGDWNNLIDAVASLKNDGVGMVFVGEGQKKDYIMKLSRNINNIDFYPYQPRENLPTVLNAADIQIISIKKGLEGLVVPSKIYPILAAKKPILGICSRATDTARIIEKYNCGEIADSDSVESIIDTIKLMMNEEKLQQYSKNAYFASTIFNQNKVIEQLASEIENYLNY